MSEQPFRSARLTYKNAVDTPHLQLEFLRLGTAVDLFLNFTDYAITPMTLDPPMTPVPSHKSFQGNLCPDFSDQQSAEDAGNLHQVVKSERKVGREKMGQIPQNFYGRVLVQFQLGDAPPFEETLPLLEGRMRMRLPANITEKMAQALQEGREVRILVDNMESWIFPEQFTKFYGQFLGENSFFQALWKGPTG